VASPGVLETTPLELLSPIKLREKVHAEHGGDAWEVPLRGNATADFPMLDRGIVNAETLCELPLGESNRASRFRKAAT